MMPRPLLLAALLVAAPAASLAADCDPSFAVGLPQAVSKRAVAAADAGTDVELWSFCPGLYFRDIGNAGGLIRTIAANPVLNDPIEAKGWRADDVKFVRVLAGRIDLWLHRDP
jgi:hypothetical protein